MLLLTDRCSVGEMSLMFGYTHPNEKEFCYDCAVCGTKRHI